MFFLKTIKQTCHKITFEKCNHVAFDLNLQFQKGWFKTMLLDKVVPCPQEIISQLSEFKYVGDLYSSVKEQQFGCGLLAV